MNDSFFIVHKRARNSDKQAAERIINQYMPLIKKYSYIKNKVDEDLLSELYLASFKCIMRFDADKSDFKKFLAEVKRMYDT